MRIRRLGALVATVGLLLAACGDSGGGDGETEVGEPATQAADTDSDDDTTPGDTTTGGDEPREAAPKISLGAAAADGSVPVEIDLASLSPLFFGFVETNPEDPFFHIHTEDSELFLAVELYTEFGNGWTGQTGTFTTDCNANGICVYLDPDGRGDLAPAGPASAGTIAITELNGGYDVTMTDLVLSTESGDATYTLAGPLNLTG